MMDNLEVLEKRFARLSKIKDDAEEQLEMITMRENEGADVAKQRDDIEELLANNLKSLEETMAAAERIKERRAAKQEE